MIDAPGLKQRRRADGSPAWYWVASAISTKAAGYPVRTVRLHGDEKTRAARCRKLTAELYEWLEQKGFPEREIGFDGSIASLIDSYNSDEDSPYRSVKANTRSHYDHTLGIIRGDVGERLVDLLTRKDFARWYRNFRAPSTPDGPERIRRAHNCMKLIRIIVNFGASMRYPGCREASLILGDMRFELPTPRDKALTFGHAKAIVERAIAEERPSMALGQALQFELSLRQKDVIGEWLDNDERSTTGVLYHGERWSGGVLWSDLSDDLILVKRTTKTATTGEWNLALSPLVGLALAAFPPEVRHGPMIVAETTGRPYRPNDYQKVWRRLADAVGVPRDVWNMDSRAGGITEGDAAGAEPRDLQRHATHSSFQTTNRYVRGSKDATERVARLRLASRTRKP